MFKDRYKLNNQEYRNHSEDLANRFNFERRFNRRSVVTKILSN